MNALTKIKYWFILGLCKAVGWLPTWFLYHVLLDILYFFIYKVARYRVKVVRLNLSNSFPNKGESELRAIERGFYYHLAEIFVDTIDMASISAKEYKKRIVFENLEEQKKAVDGTNWIAALAHYGSWEYFGGYQFYTDSQVVGVYHKLHDMAFEEFFKTVRSRFGLLPVAMRDILRYVVANKDGHNDNFILGLIADQTPPREKPASWHWFLNQKTAFFKGIETFAVKFNLPVYFMHVKKHARIRYRVTLDMIYDGKEEVRDGEITERYVRRLESMINDAPQYWMWSHRRWKHVLTVPEIMPFPKPGKE